MFASLWPTGYRETQNLWDLFRYWWHLQTPFCHDSYVWIFILQRLLSSSPISKMPCQEVAKMTDQEVVKNFHIFLKTLGKLFVGARLGEFFWHGYDWLWRGALGWGRSYTRQILKMPHFLKMQNMRFCKFWRALITIKWHFFWQDLQMWFKDCANWAKGFSTWRTTAPSTEESTKPKLTSWALEGTWWDDTKYTHRVTSNLI